MTAPKKPRRGRGEGGIRRLADGRWEDAFDLAWENGKRRRKYVHGHTRKEAVEKLRQALAHADAGLPPGDGRLTVKHLLDRWLTQSTRRWREPAAGEFASGARPTARPGALQKARWRVTVLICDSDDELQAALTRVQEARTKDPERRRPAPPPCEDHCTSVVVSGNLRPCRSAAPGGQGGERRDHSTIHVLAEQFRGQSPPRPSPRRGCLGNRRQIYPWYVNVSLDVMGLAALKPGALTVTLTVAPGRPNGLSTVISVALRTWTWGASLPLKRTVSPLMKLVPVMVTKVRLPPTLGTTDVTVGGT